jgi:hypothetical protein
MTNKTSTYLCIQKKTMWCDGKLRHLIPLIQGLGLFKYCVLKNAWTDLQDLHSKIKDFHSLSLDFYFILFPH